MWRLCCCRCGGARSKSRCCSPSPATMPPMLGRSALPSSMSCASWLSVDQCSWPSTTCSGSTGRRPGRWDSRFGVCARSASASGDGARGAGRHCAVRARAHAARGTSAASSTWTAGSCSLHRLLRGRLGLELARPEVTRVGEASGGNPFFALEIGRELARTDVALDSERPLPVPDSLSTLLGKRLERLPGRRVEVLLVAALAGRPTADVVARAYGERDALAALELAAREGVVVLEGSRVRFSSSAVWLGLLRGGAGVAPPGRTPLARRGRR